MSLTASTIFPAGSPRSMSQAVEPISSLGLRLPGFRIGVSQDARLRTEAAVVVELEFVQDGALLASCRLTAPRTGSKKSWSCIEIQE